MKKTLLRNNLRKVYANPLQQKSIHSQSPTHKKLLKKIELTQRDAPQYQYEMSLQDNLVFQKPQEEVVDFRVEIERRFQKSFANHQFVFPRRKRNYNEALLEGSDSSNNSSFESLKHVTVYELAAQNKRRNKPSKQIYKTHDEYIINGRDSSRIFSKDKEYRLQTEPERDDSDDSGEESVHIPIEIRIRDKSSNTYKKLISLLEKQLSRINNPDGRQAYLPHSEDNYAKDDQVFKSQQLQSQSSKPKKETSTSKERPQTNPHTRKNMLTKDESQKSFEYLMISKAKIGERQLEKSATAHSFQEGVQNLRKSAKTLELSQRLKKVNSKDKISSLLDASNGNAESLGSLDSRVSPNGKKALTDMSRLSQENKKKMTSSTSSLLRALTPKCITSKNITQLKDKPLNPAESLLVSSQTPSSSLYQKAQDGLLSGKMKLNTQKSQKKGLNSTNDSSKAENEIFKSLDMKAMNFIDFYGSPKVQQSVKSSQVQVSSHTMYNNFAKGRSSRKPDGNNVSKAEKSSERQSGYTSYELVNRKTVNKPTFKLDLNSSSRVPPKHRDLLSSNRTRDNLSKEKSSDMLSIDSILKGSYDMQNHSLIRNASKQSDIGKRKVGATPKGNLGKNLFMS